MLLLAAGALPAVEAPLPLFPLVPCTEQWLHTQHEANGATCLLLATDFSGLDAPAMALKGLAVPSLATYGALPGGFFMKTTISTSLADT